MKKLLLALGMMVIFSCQTLAAETAPKGAVKFRNQLEHMRLEVLRSNMMMIKLGDNGLTKEDVDFINSHATDDDAQAVGNGSQELIQSLNVAIVKLGGSLELTKDEVDSIKKTLSEDTVKP